MLCKSCGKSINDSEEKCTYCNEKIVEESINSTKTTDIDEIFKRKIEKGKAKARKKQLGVFIAIFLLIVAILSLIIAWSTVVVPKRKYEEALLLMEAGKYESAYTLLEDLNKDNEIKSSKYERASMLLETGDSEAALELFEQIRGYEDSAEKILDIKYEFAVSYIDSQNYIDAYETLIEISAHKDSKEKAYDIYREYQKQKLKTAEVGDYVFFGAYEQDDYTNNGKENIEWLVYEVTEDGCIFAISKYVLDMKQYNSTFSSVTWARSKVREWLNDDFYNDAFSDEEKDCLLVSWISSDPDSGVITIGDNSTTLDKVFLMSVDDARTCFGSDIERKCKPTEYSGAKKDDEGYCSWLLLSPGKSNSFVSYVDSDGSINESGINVNRMMGVRPTIIIDTNKLD